MYTYDKVNIGQNNKLKSYATVTQRTFVLN